MEEVPTHYTALIPYGGTNGIVAESATHLLAWTLETLPVYIEVF